MKYKKTELFFITLAIFAITSKIIQLPGTSIIMILSFTIYAIFSVIHNLKITKDSTGTTKLISILLGLGMAVCLIGIMFIFMSWTSALTLLLIGSVSCLTFASLLLLKKTFSQFKFIIIKGMVIGIFTLGIFLLPNYTIFKLKHHDDPKMVELYIAMKETKTDEAKQAFRDYLHEKRKQ